MIRKLLATTAIVTIVSTGAFAQATTEPATPAPATPPAADSAAPAASVAKADGQIATNIIGESVYNGTGDDAENIGSVNDLVLDAEGKVESIVIGVGGFLGIGAKSVAVDYSTIDWAEQDGDRWIVISATADQLKELPAFDKTPYEPAPAVASTDPAASGTTTTGSGMAPAPADDTAAAPAPAAPADDTAAAPAAPADDTAAATDETDTTQTGAIDRSKLQPLETAEIRSEDFVGTTVYGADDQNIGEIGDVILSQDGKVESVLIDVGGFLGVGEKEVAVGMENLSFLADEDGDKYLYTAFSKEQLDAAPAYDEATYAEKRDEMRLVVPN